MVGVEELTRVTSQQAGFVSSAQAARLGVPSRAVAALVGVGVLERHLRGVFRVRAAPTPADPELLAAWTLLAGDHLPWEPVEAGQPPVVVSHTSAAALLGLGTFPVSRPTFIVTRQRHDPPSGLYRTFLLSLAASEWSWELLGAGIRVARSSAERTLVDLAWAEADPDHVVAALRDGLRRGVVDPATLREVLERRWQRRGRGTPRWFLDAIERLDG
jgi:hypothetical protein